MRDPYDVLGVTKSASEADIKKAFRALAKKHHPDKHAGDPAAQKRFQEISGAYDILGDKGKRAKFDTGEIDAGGNPAHGFGAAGAGAQYAGGFRPGAAGAREFKFDWGNVGGEGGGGFDDIFADLLGGARKGRGQRQQKGEDLAAAVTVSFDEAALGGTRRVVLQNGEQLDVKIPPGVKDGQVIRVKGRGGAGLGGAPNGDILLTVTVAAHPWMTRDGNDIRMDLPVTLKEAVLGGKVPVPTLGAAVSLTIPPASNTGSVLRLKGKGIAAHGSAPAGDLYVRLVVTLPERPDDALKDFVERWSNAYDPRAKMR